MLYFNFFSGITIVDDAYHVIKFHESTITIWTIPFPILDMAFNKNYSYILTVTMRAFNHDNYRILMQPLHPDGRHDTHYHMPKFAYNHHIQKDSQARDDH